MNRVTLIGNLGRDPEIRRLENGTPVGRFSLATNDSYKDKNGEFQEQTEWHEIIVWRNQAELAEKILKKGNTVFVDGKLTHRKWTDPNGVERNITEVVANLVRLFEKRESNNSSLPNQEPPMRAKEPVPAMQVADEHRGNSSLPESEDDLPF